MKDKLVDFRGNPKIGHKMSKYRILAEIGQGGMSIVYRAKDERLGRDVALKVLHTFLAKNKECRARLAREAKIAAQLQHPNILQVFDYSGEDEKNEDPQELFIVTEFVNGVTLKEFATAYSLSQIPELGALIVWEIALALQHAHSLGVIHRDIKPENIMMREDGILKIMDFGIAQVKNLSSLTVTGTLLGSPAHMAPESIEGKSTDERADIFSLSTVLYWLLTGQLPFVSESPHALLKAIIDGRFQPPQQVSPKISDSLNQIVLRGMSTNPDQRFSSAKEMATAIAKALIELGIKPDSHELKSILANPKTQIPIFKKTVQEACLTEVLKRKKAGETAKAMSLLGRLIAENSQDKRVLQLLADYEQKKSTHIKAIGFTLIFVVIFLSLTILTTRWFEKQTPIQNFLVDLNAAIIKPSTISVQSMLEPPTTNQATKISPALPDKTKTILVTIQPYADFYVNGKLIEKDTSMSKLSLKPGFYTFVFKHRFASTIEKNIRIDNASKQQNLSVSLVKTKPAALTITSNVDADIAVNGVYKGTTNTSSYRPILIALPDKTHALNSDIILSKPGYETLLINTLFIAGQTKILYAKLQPIDKKNVLKTSSN